MKVAFTGHRPHRLQGKVDKVCAAIQMFLEYEKPSRVISGMAQGVDQLAAGLARALRIPWIAAIPFPTQDEVWPERNRQIYRKLLEDATEKRIISEKFSYNAFYIRDKWMVDNCDALVAVWDGTQYGGTYNTIEYAKSVGRDIVYLDWL